MRQLHVSLDIETAPHERAAAYYAGKRYDAPANYKDPAKIEAAILERRQADMDGAALHWWTGRVLCISAAPVEPEGSITHETFAGADERKVLCALFDWLCELDADRRVILTGKSSELFDLPYLRGRALALDTGIPDALRVYRPITDVDLIFSHSQQCAQRGKLSDYAFGLALEGKLGKGSDVSDMWIRIQMADNDAAREAAWQELTDYCVRDNDIAATMLQRYLKPYGHRTSKPIIAETLSDEELQQIF